MSNKWKKTFNNNASQTKKESIRQKNKTLQHDKNNATKFLDQYILQQGKRRRFV